ncbi:MAG: LPXTG cell wall anchor domain-containing protein, partial [Candidatus Saccharibacteria bacterium]|nr:LPXTG cell wall anchor domain-containing protein [Candidatus Saccharibacteria bacterium]
YANGSNAYVLFEAKVIDNTLDCNKRTQMINWVKITSNGVTRQDSASVLTDKVCAQKELPKTGSDLTAATVLGAGSLATALGYFIVSRKK